MSSHYTENINGWIILDKPQGVSSNQILRKIQYELRAKKAGHIGTLDPFATGVLPLAFGEATKLIPFLEEGNKTYEFTLKFKEGTSTDDTEGEIIKTSDYLPSKEEIDKILPQFIGKITQIPPKHSAIHINGQRAYELARKGTEFEIPHREITIYELKMTDYRSQTSEAYFCVTCSKGTYVRTLGHDIAEALNTCGHLTSLRRTQNGIFKISDTILLENLKNILYKEQGVSVILPVETFLCDITDIAVTEEEAQKLKHGQSLSAQRFQPLSGRIAALYDHKLIALLEKKEKTLIPIRVFNH